jgi:hypothetical protein
MVFVRSSLRMSFGIRTVKTDFSMIFSIYIGDQVEIIYFIYPNRGENNVKKYKLIIYNLLTHFYV